MKPTHSQLVYVGLCAFLSLLPGCHHGLDPDTLYLSAHGYWEWVSTTSPSGTITPQTVGYTQQMAKLMDNDGRNYVAFYRNDTLLHRYNEASGPYTADVVRNTVTLKYDSLGYLKWYIIPNSVLIKVSHIGNPNSIAPDTVVSTYTSDPYLKAKLYPY